MIRNVPDKERQKLSAAVALLESDPARVSRTQNRHAIAERGELPDLRLTPHVDLPLDWTMQQRAVGLR